MNIDFILFSAPKAKYNLIDFWGETIFIPCYHPMRQRQSHKNSIVNSFVNCYRANKATQVYFSIQNALSEQMGDQVKNQLEAGTTDTTHTQEQEVSHYIPCLFLNSMVNSKYLIMYFHSSGQDIKTSYSLLNYIRNSYQTNVLAMQYPGYSIFKGSPSSQQINQNARIVYNFVVNRLGFQEQNIIVIGRSIGSGISLQLLKPNKRESKVRNPKCLVLISPFGSVKNLVRQFVGRLGSFIAKETYDNLENIMQIKCPVFIVHGKKDTFISVDHSVQLIKNCYTRKHLLIPNDMTHSQFDFYSDLVDPLRQFLQAEGVNFYQQNMKGPAIPEQLFVLPEDFK